MVHGEIDGLITQAKASAEKDVALFVGQFTAITAPDAQLPLSMREIAGIAGQVLLDIHAATENQQQMAAAYTECTQAYVRAEVGRHRSNHTPGSSSLRKTNA